MRRLYRFYTPINVLTALVIHTLFPQEKVKDSELALDVRYSLMVKRYVKKAQLFDLRYIGDMKEIGDSLRDIIKEMIQQVLLGQDRFDPALQKQIQQHLKEIWEYENGLAPGTIATWQVIA